MMSRRPEFRLLTSDPATKARCGELLTSHGIVKTPVFLPVGSAAIVKTLTPEEVRGLGYGMILANTYHLYLRPGIDIIEKLGGLHCFMGWDGAILTDSGGYQIFSLSPLVKLSDEGILFRSHIDGSEHFISPELAIAYQGRLGSDIAMALDQCPPIDASLEKVEEALERTYNWAKRCRVAHKRSDQALYAIVQGGLFAELRREAAETLISLDYDGYAIGGLSLGESKDMTYELVDISCSPLPWLKPRYLMGVGSPEDIVIAAGSGVDIFDSALPTRIARNGALFTNDGRIDITASRFKEIDRPVSDDCSCYTCRHFSAAYLNHLFKCRDLLAYRLATIHNLFFINQLVTGLRQAIMGGSYSQFRDTFIKRYHQTDEEARLENKREWLKKQKG